MIRVNTMRFEGWWGWAPNISGDAYDEHYVKSQIQKSNAAQKRYRFDCTADGPIEVAAPIGKVLIKFRDESGICSLAVEADFAEEQLAEILLSNVWKEFRAIMDSCSKEICDCSAMNRPVKADGSNVELSIVNAFIDAMEEMSDTATYIEERKGDQKESLEFLAGRMEEAITKCNAAKINHLYGTRFLEIHSSKFSKDERILFKKIMNARCQKAEIVYEGMMRLSEIQFKKHSAKTTNRSLVVAAVSVFVAMAALAMHFF